MTKNIIIIFGFGIVIVAIVAGYLVYANQNKVNLELLVLDKEGRISLDACLERGLSDKIIVLESTYCSACKIVIPRLEELEKELGVEIIYLNLSEKDDQDRAKEFKIWPKWTPTVLIGGEVLIGAYSKEKYKEVIENFLSH
ncbi:MAG: thioredoxin family protein [Minisyncoccales bacterium]